MPILAIDDPKDPRLADYHDVPDPVLLHQRGIFVAESRLVVRTLLAHPRLLTRSLLTTQAALVSLGDLLRNQRDQLPIYVGSPQVLRDVVGFHVHRGCLALGERPTEVTDTQLAPLRDARLVVVLEQVANPDNVGSVFRNAAAFGVQCVLLSPQCSDPLYRKAIRTSLGATLRIPYAVVDDWPEGLTRLNELGYTTVALTPEVETEPLDTFVRTPPPRVAIVLGTEGSGLSDEAAIRVSRQVRIPIAPNVDSLNVATAAGIALYSVSRAIASSSNPAETRP
ncbi:MAG: RNA methyltransferase [Acidobacteriota bacterium]|nr:RNA methyltransferase [Acidobacteriota bacterium]